MHYNITHTHTHKDNLISPQLLETNSVLVLNRQPP
jgi:hypothetical protein